MLRPKQRCVRREDHIYDMVQATIDVVPRSDMIIVPGDMNANKV